MNHENPYNDPIERLFREKAEMYEDTSYREDDWKRLENRLDKLDLRRSYRRRMALLAAASILIISLLGYYTLQNRSQIHRISDQIEQMEQERSVPAENVRPSNEKRPTGETNPANSETGTEEDKIPDPSGNENSLMVQSGLNPSTIITGMRDEGSDLSPTIEEPPIRAQSLAGILTNEEMQISSGINDFNKARMVLLSKGPTNRITGGNPIQISDGFRASSTDLMPEIDPNQPGTALGFVLSPDMSTAGSVSNFHDPGFKGGLMAEIPLNQRFSVVGGVLMANVRYRAIGNEYDTSGYGTIGRTPEETTALCLILDIPVGLKANLLYFKRSRIFATAGVSSYIMLNEQYEYRYASDSFYGEERWEGRTGTVHPASNAAISVGFELDVADQWTLRAEPHIKIPMSGVGRGNVDLYSFGSFLSLNYNFPPKPN